MEDSTVEGNKLIAIFDGWRFIKLINEGTENELPLFQKFQNGICVHDGIYHHPEYHERWDLLMPVIQKIKECRIMINDSATPVIMQSGLVKRELLHLDIQKTWKAIVAFINWYNNEKSQPK